MSNFKTIVLLVVPVALATGIAIAQNGPQEKTDQITPASLLGSMDVGSMYDQLTDAALRVTDRYLDHISKPETATKLAKFQKNYYDALLEQGFNQDQAFTLVREAGSPLAQAPRIGK